MESERVRVPGLCGPGRTLTPSEVEPLEAAEWNSGVT